MRQRSCVRGSGMRWPKEVVENASAACNYRAPELAQWLGVSTRHLRRVFANQFGCSPAAWLREQRLQAACRLLLSGTPIKEVAFELGFRQVSHFSRDFRRYFGRSPSSWRQHVTQPVGPRKNVQAESRPNSLTRQTFGAERVLAPGEPGC